MARPYLLTTLSLTLLVLFQGTLATRQQRQLQQDICQINKLDSLEPDRRIQCEGGLIETWDPNHEQFRCAGVAVARKTIEPNGLLLPSYSNAATLVYVVQGSGIMGALFPGCPETYQESQQESFRGRGRRSFQDQHQKIIRFREGHVFALPAGVSHWCYNDGNEPLVFVALLDTTNVANQLDFQPRNFYLAGNPDEEFKQLQEQSQGRRRSEHFREQGQRGTCNNLFCGMETRLIAEAFNVDERLARRLQSENDGRSNIIIVEGGLEVVTPPSLHEEREQQESERYRRRRSAANGLEETFCSMRLTENIGDPSRADVFTPEAGRLSTVNSNNLPILQWLRLSAEHGVLYNEGIRLPHWNLNAHSILYGIRGQGRVQVVDHQGQNVFDGRVQKGEVLVIPQNFAVIKKCEGETFEYVCFKTNDMAMTNSLAGKTSAIRALPVEVLANAFQINLEDARRLKFARQEASFARSGSSQSGKCDEA